MVKMYPFTAFSIICAVIVGAIAMVGMLLDWSSKDIKTRVRNYDIYHHAKDCVGDDIHNERKIAECHAAAVRHVNRLEELRNRGYRPLEN